MANQAKRGQGGAVKRSGFAAKRRRAAWRMASMLCAVAALAAAVTAAVALSLRGGRLPAVSMPMASDIASATTASITTASATTASAAASSTISATVSAAITTIPVTTTAAAITTAAPTTAAPLPTFIPDYREGHANTSTRNYAVRSFVANDQKSLLLDWQDEWVYRSDGVKFRRDGTGELIRFCEGIYLAEMSVIGDWVYYTQDNCVKRVRTDGAVTETLAEGNLLFGFFISEEKLYYADITTDAFAREIFHVHCIDLKSGAKSARRTETLMRLRTAVPVGDCWLLGDSRAEGLFNPVTGDYRELTCFEAVSGVDLCSRVGNTLYYREGVCFDWQSEELYTLDICHPTLPGSCQVQVVFADEASECLAVSFTDENGRPVDMCWYYPDTGAFGDSLPSQLWMTASSQRYLSDGQGRVYLVQEKNGKNTVIFSCRTDGSDYVRYTYA